MPLLITCLLVWACATAAATAALLLVMAVQRVTRPLGGRRSALPRVVPYPEAGVRDRGLARA